MTLDSEKDKIKYKRETILKAIAPPKTEKKNTDTHIPMLLDGQKFSHPIISCKDIHYFSKYSLSN